MDEVQKRSNAEIYFVTDISILYLLNIGSTYLCCTS
jgi:hypothetical protein